MELRDSLTGSTTSRIEGCRSFAKFPAYCIVLSEFQVKVRCYSSPLYLLFQQLIHIFKILSWRSTITFKVCIQRLFFKNLFCTNLMLVRAKGSIHILSFQRTNRATFFPVVLRSPWYIFQSPEEEICCLMSYREVIELVIELIKE